VRDEETLEVTQDDEALIKEAINALNKMDLIDLYYPTYETIAALLRVPPERREALLHRILGGASGKDRHIARVLAIVDAAASRDKS
jgi:hypothetical protein